MTNQYIFTEIIIICRFMMIIQRMFTIIKTYLYYFITVSVIVTCLQFYKIVLFHNEESQIQILIQAPGYIFRRESREIVSCGGSFRSKLCTDEQWREKEQLDCVRLIGTSAIIITETKKQVGILCAQVKKEKKWER